ncbi:hypothetical protein K439DRAFT_285401 [Ramaria rubella]|nr:hypothetical protein K439DRAFT_285401 [Ramaria rubella]
MCGSDTTPRIIHQSVSTSQLPLVRKFHQFRAAVLLSFLRKRRVIGRFAFTLRIFSGPCGRCLRVSSPAERAARSIRCLLGHFGFCLWVGMRV